MDFFQRLCYNAYERNPKEIGMKNIRLATSMIFDFICIPTQLEYFEYNAFRFTPEQKSALEKIKELLDEELNKSPYSFSTLCDIVAVYLPSPETATLDELYNMFLNMDDVEKVCREKITNEFTLSYTLSLVQQIKNGGDKIIRNQIRAFQRIGFEELGGNTFSLTRKPTYKDWRMLTAIRTPTRYSA